MNLWSSFAGLSWFLFCLNALIKAVVPLMTLLPIANAEQSGLIQVELLRLLLLLETAAKTELSKETWKDYQASDYDSTHAFCLACLVDKNPPQAVKRLYLCWLPIMSPETQVVNRQALQKAQKLLLNPQATEVPQVEAWRQEAAQKLVAVMEHYELKPSQKLLKLAAET